MKLQDVRTLFLKAWLDICLLFTRPLPTCGYWYCHSLCHKHIYISEVISKWKNQNQIKFWFHKIQWSKLFEQQYFTEELSTCIAKKSHQEKVPYPWLAQPWSSLLQDGHEFLYFREGRSKKLFPWTPKISSCLEYNTKILVFYNFFRHGGKLLTYIIICNYQLKHRTLNKAVF